MNKKLLIIGGHGSGEIAMSIFEDINSITKEWDIVGYLSDIKEPGQKLGKHTIIGPTAEIMDYVNKGYYVHNTLFFNAKDKKNRVWRIPSELVQSWFCMNITSETQPKLRNVGFGGYRTNSYKSTFALNPFRNTNERLKRPSLVGTRRTRANQGLYEYYIGNTTKIGTCWKKCLQLKTEMLEFLRKYML